MPEGIDRADIPADLNPCLGGDCGFIMGMSPLVGLCIFRAVMGVVPAVVTEEVDGVEPLYQVSDTLPSLFSDLGAGGAK